MSIKNIFQLNFWLLFLGLCIANLIAMYGVSNILWDDDTYLKNFTGSDFQNYISSIRSIDLYRYLLSPFYLLIKSFAVASVFYSATILIRKEIEFVSLLHITLVAEIAFILVDLSKVFWFLVVQPEYSATDLKEFYPLSLYQAIGGIEGWLSYPLRTINIFQIIYIIVVARGLKTISVSNESQFAFTFTVYGLSLFFWIILWSFIGISFLN